MGIILDKSELWPKKKIRVKTQIFFVLEQNFITATTLKMGNIIGVSEVNFYSKIVF